MNGNPLFRQPDALSIPEGAIQEPYTPVAGRIISPSTGKKLAYVKMYLQASASVTWKDLGGNQITFTLQAGPQPFIVTEISAAGTSIMIIHNNIIWSQDSSVRDMTATLPTV